ncbi:MAG: MFS transporter [Ndongobacter sp.]|nr:MFS transporter [Ndongobacter sp.]
MKKLTKAEKSWILYDCGNSAYSMAITTALLPIYFGMFKPGDGMDLGYFNSVASILVALLSPILGTFADYQGRKKKLFTIFSLLGIGCTAGLALVPYYNWQLLVTLYIIGAIGFSGANIFYDAFLVDVSAEQDMDRVSSMGYAYGYIASVLPFALCLMGVYFLGMDKFAGYQLGFFITALWWLVLTIPMYRNVRQNYYIEPVPNPVRMSFRRLGQTMKNIRQYRVVALFLLAYFLYIDGVDTIIKMVVPYAEQVLGGTSLDMFLLLGILLVIQIIAFPCALIYGKLAGKVGTKRMIQFAILTYIISVFFAGTITSVYQIFILGAMVGSAQGGIQALSRSFFAKIVPKEQSNEFFGFYNIFGKFAAILGPLIMSLVTDITGDARLSIYGILPLFVCGLILTFFLPKTGEEVGEKQ